MKRIFIAIKVEPGDTLLNIISLFKSELKNEKIKWTSLDNIHMTLKFLGDTKERDINNIARMLKEQCEGSGIFELIIKGTGVFKNLNNPRVLWTGIELSERLIQLNNNITYGLRNAGVLFEDHPFRPHLTFGRIRFLKDKETLKTISIKFQDTVIQRVSVNEVILYESILLQSGPVYDPLIKIALKQN